VGLSAELTPPSGNSGLWRWCVGHAGQVGLPDHAAVDACPRKIAVTVQPRLLFAANSCMARIRCSLACDEVVMSAGKPQTLPIRLIIVEWQHSRYPDS